MRGKNSIHSLLIIAAFAGVLLAQVYGCGVSTDLYVEKVLERWPDLEARSEWLAEGLEGLREAGGPERLWLLAGEARQAADSFRRDLRRRIIVPDYQQKFNDLLISFLADYVSYLEGLQDYLDVAMLGEPGEEPDLEGLAAQARQSLGDYQDAQEYNGARIGEGVWDLARALEAAVAESGYAVPGQGESPTLAQVPGPEDALDAWYGLFNQGDGEAMYYMLSPYSPILEECGMEELAARVEEARASSLLAACEVLGVEAMREEGLDWAVIQVAVDYGESGREEFTVELDYVNGLWMITSVNSASGIW